MSSLNPELVRGSLDLMILSVLSDGSQYGYLIQQKLKEASGELVDSGWRVETPFPSQLVRQRRKSLARYSNSLRISEIRLPTRVRLVGCETHK